MSRERIEQWFADNDWTIFDFQREVWDKYLAGESGLIHSATGSGKTLAAWLGPVQEAMQANDVVSGIQVLWITPLRALAGDTLDSMRRPIRELGLDLSIEMRTGDTSSSDRAKQKRKPPFALITTPESVSLMLSQADPSPFSNLRAIIVDEWHELLSSKRGVQTELAIARLKALAPQVRVWGISATLGNLSDAMTTLCGPDAHLVQGVINKEIVIDSIIPENIQRFPWAGHFGVGMIPSVIEAIEQSRSCLVFTNTRAMAEIWHQQILALRPDWADQIGLHHGSLERSVREGVEKGLKEGALRCVVCTSSLDLGVDFSPVDRVIQVGSPKGVARLLQRAGRSGHRPGVPSRVTCVPTHAFELIDIASTREAAQKKRIESRQALKKPLDVLCQHLVTIATGPGFEAEAMFHELRTTTAYASLTREEFDACLDFVTSGGNALKAYPQFRKLKITDGRFVVDGDDIAQRHRMSIGTIVADSAVNVQLLSGGRLGTVEESFVARLKPGDRFLFAGQPLEYLRLKDMNAIVRRTKSTKGLVPRWAGGRLPLSSELSQAIRQSLQDIQNGEIRHPELHAVLPILEVQARWSSIPQLGELLIEQVEDREGHHLFVYPFEGRLVHEGLGALFAYRLGQLMPVTCTVACNDYGFELLSEVPVPLNEEMLRSILSVQNLGEDILASLNAAEMAKRHFREVARVAGLIFQGYPGAAKTAKQLQVSSGLLFDVFARFDSENILLKQSFREVLERQLEESRIGLALGRIEESALRIEHPPKPTPLSFPILVDRLRDTITSEPIGTVIERMVLDLEEAANID